MFTKRLTLSALPRVTWTVALGDDMLMFIVYKSAALLNESSRFPVQLR